MTIFIGQRISVMNSSINYIFIHKAKNFQLLSVIWCNIPGRKRIKINLNREKDRYYADIG